MKHPTDEEIEDKIIERLKKINSKSLYEITREESQFLYGYERGFRESAKWARDQQPKLKPLVWDGNIATSHGMGMYEVFYSKASCIYKWRKVGSRPYECDSIDHGKQLAQADYERRINELYI